VRICFIPHLEYIDRITITLELGIIDVDTYNLERGFVEQPANLAI
jgi:hypothetical protein